MLPRPFALLWLAGAFALGGCFLFEDPPVSVPDPAPLFVSDGTACGDACANRLTCSYWNSDAAPGDWMAECMAECGELGAESELVSCWKASACGELSDCDGPGAHLRDCESACRVLTDCGIVEPGRCSCLGISVEIQECLSSADCNQAVLCLGESGEQGVDCGDVCDQLIRCGRVPQERRDACIEECRFDLDGETRRCIQESQCEVLGPLCLSNYPTPSCETACRRLADCDRLNGESRSACGERCIAEDWTDETRLCVHQTLCGELPGECEVSQ